MKARELMTGSVIALSHGQTLGETARLFVEKKIDGAPLVDEAGIIRNIITKTDIMRAYINRVDPQTPVGSLPEKSVLTIHQDTNILDVWSKAIGRLPVVDDTGNLVGMLTRTDLCYGFYHNGMDEDRVNELDAARAISKKLDVIIESSFDGIYITDGQANTLMVNKSYETITGLKRDELIGHNMLELVDTKMISQSATLLVLQDKTTKTIEQEFKTGKRALVTSTPILGADGEIDMVVTNVRDITALLNLRSQMEKNRELANRYLTEIEEMRLQILDTSDIIAQDEQMLDTLRMAKRVSKVDTTVLVLGETGVGKEEVAKFIHKSSNRNAHAFIKVNCGAIPENLMESELFGYESGSFTGASKEGKIGLFEVANGGTLFLDEVGELPFDMQVRLLRVLQDHEIVRVGGLKPIKVDVRIIAATNRNLEEMVRTKKFREDLFYRLHVVPINILPLRERKEDILPLIHYFNTELNRKYSWQKSFSRDAMTALLEYEWPGNVRELKNIVERMMVMSDQDVISLSDLSGVPGFSGGGAAVFAAPAVLSIKEAVDQLEAEMIDKAFKKHGNVRDAAKELKIDASTFVRKRQKFTKDT